MTREQVRAWRQRQRWTQEEAGLWCGLSPKSAARSWRRWESGERTVPPWLVLLIKALDSARRIH